MLLESVYFFYGRWNVAFLTQGFSSEDLNLVSLGRPSYSLYSSDDGERFPFPFSYANLLIFVTAFCLRKLFLPDFHISTCLETLFNCWIS